MKAQSRLQKRSQLGTNCRHSIRLEGQFEIIFGQQKLFIFVCKCKEQCDVIKQGDFGYLLEALREGCTTPNRNFFWLIDEALAVDWISMVSLVDETDLAAPDIAVHSLGMRDPHVASMPSFGIVHLKKSLALKILESSEAIQGLVNYGWSAAIGALGAGISVLEWGKHDEFQRFFHPDFPNCANPEVAPGIHFPVDDDGIQEAICSLNLDLAERLGSRVQAYVGNKHRGWFVEDVGRWRHWFGRNEATRVLEIAPTDGISTNAMLDLLFPHPASEVHCIQSAAESPDTVETLNRFAANAEAGVHMAQVHLYTGQPVEVLAWMIAEEGYWESFDFIHFKPMENQIETMTAVGQAWSLLKPGGVIVLDSGMARIGESHPAKVVLETCARVIGNQADPLLNGEIIALKKRPALEEEENV